MVKIPLGLLLGLAIAAACRWFNVPVPSPPSLIVALLVIAMTVHAQIEPEAQECSYSTADLDYSYETWRGVERYRLDC